jgi:hypothetical protein
LVTGSEAPLFRGRALTIAAFQMISSEQKDIRFELLETRQLAHGLFYSLVQPRSTLIVDRSQAALKSFVIFRKTSDKLLCEVDFFAAGEYAEVPMLA